LVRSAVSEFPSRHAAGGALEAWLDIVSTGRTPEQADLIRRAALRAETAHADQTRASGEPYVSHVLAVAGILNELGLDHETIAAALLHDTVEDTATTLAELESEFGPAVARLVDGVTKMEAIEDLSTRDREKAREKAKEDARIESLRKMLLAMVDDPRVVLVKLADRLHNLRTLKALPDDRRRAIARETLDIYAPLANRLGVWQLKWELEDLSFRALEPETYRQIAERLAERLADRAEYLEGFLNLLRAGLAAAGVRAEVTGRPKHIYSIYHKMRRKGLDFENIHDLRGARVLVDSVADCYAALGVVHTHWTAVPGEFDDYIATPKENHYQSIHTAVLGPEGKIVEVQIRTREMHERNELGIAAHWRYKEDKRADGAIDRKVAWLRQLMEWKDEVADAGEFVERVKSEVFEDRVYVFTPRGQVIDLPRGATPIDFAYAVHTEVGHRCRGAKVNGRIVPLTYALRTGEQIEILATKSGGPSRDWLNPHLGYVVTPKARSRIQHWFKEQGHGESVAQGREMLARELERVGLREVNLERLARALDLPSVDAMHAMIANGELKTGRVLHSLQEQAEPPMPVRTRPVAAARMTRAGGPVRIAGVGDLLTQLGRCCHPVPGDGIVGYITRGHGVTVHRLDCPNVVHAGARHEERWVDVEWSGASGGLFPIGVAVTAQDRRGLLRDISTVLADTGVNVLAVHTDTGDDQIARMVFTIEIEGIERLSQVLARLNQVPDVLDARRQGV
jgi:GTP pyrophosphokinase